LDWRTKVELYEQIRREYEFGTGSIIGVARQLGVHRRTVREAVRSALPARRKKTERPHLKIAPAAAFIDEVLTADRKAPRKQRHTAKRIWDAYPPGGAGVHGSRADSSPVCGAA
jgi:transposase-like protein